MPDVTEQSLRDQSLPHSGNVMIVDDNPANLKLLEDMLCRQGYDVWSFPRGRLALAAADEEPPDLILLDIDMPEMNGFEVCRRLKSNAALSGIPVIFLSALNETQDKVKALQSGGVDYISKPFQFEEVHARVETHLKLHQLQRALKQQNQRLDEAVAARTRELTEANRLLTVLDCSKNEYLYLISHEIRTPLNGLLVAGELILEGMPSTEENHELRDVFERSRQRILAILEDALLLTEINVNGEQFKSAQVCLQSALGSAIEKTAEFAESHRVGLPPPPAGLDLVLGDEDLLVRAFHALLATAVRFSQDGETVRLIQKTAPDSRTVVMESRGKSIPDPALPKFFDIFSLAEISTPGGDLGLGPAVAHRILALFGASVTVVNGEPSGIRLIVKLKKAAPNRADAMTA
jgi:two-component system, sensor histidine kinase and response regulator